MINASKLIKDILSGNLTVHELVQGVENLASFSFGAVDYNLIVNTFLGMGSKLSIKGDYVAVVPHDSKEVELPASMTMSHPRIFSVTRDPFMLLQTYPYAFARAEILFQTKEKFPTLAVPYSEVIDLKKIVGMKKNRVPALMVAIPVLCGISGEIKFVRISLVALAQAERNILDGGFCNIRGKGPRRKINVVEANVTHNFDEKAALEKFSAELDQFKKLYEEPSAFALEQVALLRSLFDIRYRDVNLIQSTIGQAHKTPETVD